MKKFVIGDIHGNYKALTEVLTLSGFQKDQDKLIILGDICDGHNRTRECVEEILTIPNRVFVLGNHDLWFIDYLVQVEKRPEAWIHQGGDATLESYERVGDIPENHRKFFLTEHVPYHEEDNMCFVHGGFPYGSSPRFEPLDELLWNRSLCYKMKELNSNGKTGLIQQYEHVFVGHTTTQLFGNVLYPLTFGNLTMLDCGGGWDGKLAMMDIHTKKYWLSGASKIDGD